MLDKRLSQLTHKHEQGSQCPGPSTPDRQEGGRQCPLHREAALPYPASSPLVSLPRPANREISGGWRGLVAGFHFCRRTWKLQSTVHQFYQLIFSMSDFLPPRWTSGGTVGSTTASAPTPHLSLSLQASAGAGAQAWSFGGDRRAPDHQTGPVSPME